MKLGFWTAACTRNSTEETTSTHTIRMIEDFWLSSRRLRHFVCTGKAVSKTISECRVQCLRVCRKFSFLVSNTRQRVHSTASSKSTIRLETRRVGYQQKQFQSKAILPSTSPFSHPLPLPPLPLPLHSSPYTIQSSHTAARPVCKLLFPLDIQNAIPAITAVISHSSILIKSIHTAFFILDTSEFPCASCLI